MIFLFLIIHNFGLLSIYKIYANLVILRKNSKMLYLNLLKRFVTFISQEWYHQIYNYTTTTTQIHTLAYVYVYMYSLCTVLWDCEKWSHNLKLCRMLLIPIKGKNSNCSVTYNNFVQTLKILLLSVLNVFQNGKSKIIIYLIYCNVNH